MHKKAQTTRDVMKKAVAYYRCATQSPGKDPIAVQKKQVHTYAKKYRIKIIGEFTDRCKSGLTFKGRKGIQNLMKLIARNRGNFDYILTYNCARVGRNLDLDIYFRNLCDNNKIRVIYVENQIASGLAPDAFKQPQITLSDSKWYRNIERFLKQRKLLHKKEK